MSKSIQLLCLFTSLILFFVVPSICKANPGGHWELVDVKSGEAKNHKERCSEERVTMGEGTFSFYRRYFQGVCNQRKEEIFSATAKWIRPRKRLNPGEVQNISLDAKRGSNVPGLHLSFGVSLSTDNPHCPCGSVCGGKDLGRAVIYSREENPDTATKTVKFKVPSGSKGESFALRFCSVGAGHQPGFRYIYQWVQTEENNNGSAGHKSKSDVEPETTEFTWSDYAKEFEEVYTPEQQAEAIARMTPEQRAELKRARTELKTEKPENPPKKETPRPVPEMTRKQFLIKEWDFEQSMYRSYEKDMITPLKKCLEEMEKSKERLQLIKKSYEKEFGRPLPIIRDYTATRYPPQTPRQEEALRVYEAFKTTSEAHREALDLEEHWINDQRELPIVNTRADRESGDAATRNREALEEQLNQIKEEWTDDLHRDFGPLKKGKTIPDPQHDPVDPRKKPRQVDAMEYKIKDGAHFEKRYIQQRRGSNPTHKFSKRPDQNQAEPEKANIPVDRSDERGFQGLGQKNTQPKGSQTAPSVRDEGIPKGHTTKYGF
jgi:hypothetical protein